MLLRKYAYRTLLLVLCLLLSTRRAYMINLKRDNYIFFYTQKTMNNSLKEFRIRPHTMVICKFQTFERNNLRTLHRTYTIHIFRITNGFVFVFYSTIHVNITTPVLYTITADVFVKRE